MESSHALSSLEVDRVLRLDALSGIPGYETEELDMSIEVFEREFGLGTGIKIVKTHTGKVGDNNITGQVTFRQSCKVVERLLICSVEVTAKRFVLGNQCAAPEKVYAATLGGLLIKKRQLPDRLFKACDPSAGNAENIKELIPEGLGLSALDPLTFPLAGKGKRTVFYLIQ